MLTAVSDDTNSSLSPSAACAAWDCRCFNSSGVNVARSPRFAGRCIGMLAVAGHCPCKSGSPQAVFGAVYPLAVFAAGLAVCAARGIAINARARNRLMETSLLLTAVGIVRVRAADKQLLAVRECHA